MKSQTLYKLTDADMKTRGAFQWTIGKTRRARGGLNQGLCSNGWLHAYEDPDLALLLNPSHANIKNPRLFEARGVIRKRDGQMKVGCRALTLVREIPVRKITAEQRAKFAILCALTVYKNEEFRAWANRWMDGTDRSADAAANAANAAAADATAAYSATYAARDAAAAAAAAAAYAEKSIDLKSIAREALA